MRGKGIKPCNQRVRMGITPAYAGKRLHRFDHCRLQRDHPRICGEKSLPRQCTCHPWGSPPHMRGKEQAFRLDASELGITPAYAGKSCRGKQRRACQRDHPRICGEKLFFCWFASARLGSPPHMRGKVGVGVLVCASGRITPAYAGKSDTVQAKLCMLLDHPRICGEKRRCVRR